MAELIDDRILRRALIAIALAGLVVGLIAWITGQKAIASWVWGAGTVPVVLGLAVSIFRDLKIGRAHV